MTDLEVKEKAVFIVKKLEEEGSTVIPHYLAFYVVGCALAKTGTDIPIYGIDPITASLLREINRINPGLSGLDLNKIRMAVCDHLIDNNYIENYFTHREM